MNLKLQSRSESAGNDKLQLQFSEDTAGVPMGMHGSGVQLSGWFDREVAMGYTVGATYTMTLTEVAS